MTATVVILLCILIAGALTGTVTAVRSVSRIWLRHWVERRLRGSEAGELFLERPQRLLLTGAAMSSAVVFLAGGALATAAGDHAVALGVAATAVVGAFWVLGQLLPRALARRWPTRFVPVLLPALRAVDLVVAPLVAASQRLASRGPNPVAEADPAPQARDALHELLEEGMLEGVGEPQEIAIITGVVEFADKTARDVMTPRSAIFAVDASLPIPDVARRIAVSGYSRVPVYRGSLDALVGLVNAFDLLAPASESELPLRAVVYTDPKRRCNELLAEMMRRRQHLMMVVDEERRVVGLVTLEDLLEELVGDIRDEHDEPEVPPAAAST
jgi:putative hemolysin